ncbi:MAG: type II toxin-antitoxin system VapC family toxin [Sulfolobales archaeon]
MRVVDTSALVAFFLREENWRELAGYMEQTLSLYLVVAEFYNALWKAVRRRYLTSDNAKRIAIYFNDYHAKNMVLEPENLYVDRALEIALENNITVYDALYIAQAQKHRKPLLTLDTKQREVARKLGISILP